jgi:hypothetical protein
MRELADWLRERVVTPRIALLAAVVLVAAVAAGALLPEVATALLLLAMLVQFRLLDDLADRAYDRAHAPDRVLARASDLRAFVMLLGGSIGAVALALAVLAGWVRALAYLAFFGCALGWYAALPSLGPRRTLRSSGVLLKYPVFVLLLATTPTSPRALAVALALYMVLALHEWRDRRPGTA